jgi:hypothetical protein
MALCGCYPQRRPRPAALAAPALSADASAVPSNSPATLALPASALSADAPHDLTSPLDRELLGVRAEPCSIPNVALRAITLSQLERVLALVRARCKAGALWHMIRGGGPTPLRWEAVALDADEVNLYHFTETILKPLTTFANTPHGGGSKGSANCSLVELMADGPQEPVSFVSHYWGEPIAHFVACLRRYAEDRGHGPDTPYWVRCSCWSLRRPNSLAYSHRSA